MSLSEGNLKLEISKIMPIEKYEGYNIFLEYSDKIVLPVAVCHFLVRNSVHFPPIFALYSKRFQSDYALCGALEYTAESSTIYCPSRIYKQLRFPSWNKCDNSGVLQVLSNHKQKYAFPELKKIEVYSDSSISEIVCKSGLIGYSIIKTGQSLLVREI